MNGTFPRRLRHTPKVHLRLVPVAACLLLVATIARGQATDGPETDGANPEDRLVPDQVEAIAQMLAEATYEDPRRAAELGRGALARLTTPSDPEFELTLTCGVCRALAFVGEVEAAQPISERCVALAEEAEAISWLAWGHSYCLARGYSQAAEIGLAAAHGERAIELYESIGDRVHLAFTLTRTGNVLGDLGDLPTATAYQLRALELFIETGERNGQAQALLRLGTIAADRDDLESAYDYAQRAYEAFSSIGSDNGMAAALNNLGMVLSEQGRLDEALKLLDASLAIKLRLDQPRSVAIRMINIGSIHAEQGHLDEALDQHLRAVEMLREVGARREEALAGIELASTHRRRGELDRALASVAAALHVAETIDFEENAVDGYRLIAEIHEARGDLPASIDAWKRYDEIKDRYLDNQSERTMVEMAARYRTESQAREIDSLRQDRARQATEAARQRDRWTALLLGSVLLLAVLALLVNRYRLRAEASAMAVAVEREKAISAGLRDIDRLKDEFLANTSHELRTPLVGIVGLSESLLDGAAGELPEPARADLELIRASGDRLGTLVGDILDHAKLGQGRFDLTREGVDLHSVADVVVTLSRPLIDGRPVGLVNRVPKDLPPAWADSDRLQQILHNLIGNALRFTEHGEVVVDAALVDSSDEAPDRLRVSVRDTGIGIAPSDHASIFEPFEQVDASIERLHGGTGLGLTICRQLVGLHGGTLTVESTLGEGSTFSFELPQAPDDVASAVDSIAASPSSSVLLDARPRRFDEAPPPTPRPDASETILVVDDKPVNRRVLNHHLVAAGYRVVCVASGDEALTRLDEASFDLVLLDIMMPRMSGYEVCRRIRQHHSRDELPVLFLSAKNQPTDRIASFELGGNDYLAKPIAKQELTERVATQLDVLRAHRSRATELKILRGLLTICADCKKIRDPDDGEWNVLESYIDRHSEATFSHGLCPTCASRAYSAAFPDR